MKKMPIPIAKSTCTPKRLGAPLVVNVFESQWPGDSVATRVPENWQLAIRKRKSLLQLPYQLVHLRHVEEARQVRVSGQRVASPAVHQNLDPVDAGNICGQRLC